ncbi:Yip1 family protein [uncultured Parasphingopyxis sp.]|uniref:Yip1 family protein n=2 Tax=Parasphingopyxis TaxID=1234545 RepID=UPI002635411E|nr:Yip1 family protein [uncultured Parasphingopyxis sp.]
MSLIDRVKNIITTPRTEWPVIESETTTIGNLFTGYAMILALVPVIGTILFGLLFEGPFGIRYNMGFLITLAIIGYIVSLGVLYLMGIIADALAPTFEGTKNSVSAMKLLVYSATAAWIAGFFTLINGIGIIIALAGFAWAAFLLYLGSQVLMKVPQKNALAYTAVTIVIWIIISFIVNQIVTRIALSAMGGPTAAISF